MVNADMCEHGWPGSGCKECKIEQVTRGTVWIYKDVKYIVGDVLDHLHTQDPVTGKWGPTVIYRSEKSKDRVFGRTITEFVRKFGRVW